MHEAHAGWHLALEGKAAAETNADFEAEALLQTQGSMRARPPSKREENV